MTMINDEKSLVYCTEKERDDYCFVLNRVSQKASEFKHASKRLRDNEDIVIAALYAKKNCKPSKTNDLICLYAGPNALKSLKVALATVECGSSSDIKALDESLQENSFLIFEGVKHGKIFMLEKLEEDKKDDKEFMLNCVKVSSGAAFEYASERLRYSKEFFLLSLRSSRKHIITILKNTCERNINDEGVCLHSINIDPSSIQCFNLKLQSTDEILKKCLKKNVHCFNVLDEALRTNKLFVLKVLDIVDNPKYIYDFLDNNLKQDFDIRLKCFKKNVTRILTKKISNLTNRR